MPPKVFISRTTFGLPPIKLDGYIYFVLSGTYSRVYNEKQIEDSLSASGAMVRQIRNTEKMRYYMSLLVPTYVSDVEFRDGIFEEDIGTISYLHYTLDRMPPIDLVEYYDIDKNWVYDGYKSADVLVSSPSETPWGDDINTWQVPIALWGETYTP